MTMVKVGDRWVTSRGPNKKPHKRQLEDHLPKDEHGNYIGGPGRPKGVPNKISGEAKKMIALAYEGIGGLKRFIDWADKNPTAFYTIVYPKIIALQVQGRVDLDVNLDGEKARQQLEAAFLGVIAARRAGTEDPAVYIDGERLRDVTPQLVIPRKTGTDTS